MAWEYSPAPPRRPHRPLARVQLVRAVIFACGSRVALRNEGWISTLAMNDILDETGASHGTLEKLVELGLIEKRRVVHSGSRKEVSEWRAGPDAKRWLATQKDVESIDDPR